MRVSFLYVHDEQGYWHFSRMLKLYELLDHFSSPILLIWWKLEAPQNKNFYKLPYATEFEDYTDGWKKDQKNLNIRKEFIKNILKSYDSYDLFIDYFPFWRIIFADEIDMLIEETHRVWWKFYSVMRDIFTWYPRRDKAYYSKAIKVLKNNNITLDITYISPQTQRRIYNILKEHKLVHWAINIMLDYYLQDWKIDKILVFGDRDVYDLRKEFFLSEWRERKFIFLWYQKSKKVVTNKLNWNDTPYVLVCFWWNIFDKRQFIKILNICRSLSYMHFKIILGSMMGEVERMSIKKKFQFYQNIEFIDFSEKYHSLFLGAKAFIGWWWYGTMMDVIEYDIPSFLFVNQNNIVRVNETEQTTRIKLLKKHGNILLINEVNYDFIKKLSFAYLNINSRKVGSYKLQFVNSNLLYKIIKNDE